MKFFRNLRAKAKDRQMRKKNDKIEYYEREIQEMHRHGNGQLHQPVNRTGKDYTAYLPPNVVSNILSFVCPHALDASLTSSEESMTEDGCMLCDMRDLAHCALVSTRWYGVTQKLLYQHVRIDAVHYCELEVILAKKRKRSSFLNHNAEPLDAPKVRLLLFMRTVRESQELGNFVLSLRMPYMTRESSKSELARTISVLPNLCYVDLPAGFFTDDVSSLGLKQELMARCPDIRRMKYAHGAEAGFSHIPNLRAWGNLEVLELTRLKVDTMLLRTVLSCFPKLQDLKLEDMPWIDDTTFKAVPTLPSFPPLQRLTLIDIPHVTDRGLVWFLSMSDSQDTLRHLSIINTGVLPHMLHEAIARAPLLTSLSITQEVTRPFPPENIPPMTSNSLTLLHYEVTSEGSSYGMQPVSTSYYTYLMSSLMSGSLPSLTDLYVRDASFPETLMLAPPPKVFGGGGGGGGGRGNLPPGLGLNQSLSVYSKGLDELEWNFTTYEPMPTGAGGRRASSTRPLSLHGAQLSPAWGGDARKSMLVGNGFGGFLAVPVDDERPKSSSVFSLNQRGKQDLWR